MLRTLRGVHIRHNKHTKYNETAVFPIPKEVLTLMSQNMGAACEPTVEKGDAVTVGQKIGDSDAYMSVPVHSSVSGYVRDISDYLLPDGKKCKAILIEADGLQTIHPAVAPPEITDKKSFVAAIRESGLCGLGGAGFPTHVKLNYDPVKTPINMLIINAAECEPYITSDFREILEHPNDILEGILLVQKHLGIPNCKICIEDNAPEAIEAMKKKMEFVNSVEVVSLPSAYPQGAEKVVIYSATGRIVRDGELPAHRGVLTLNVSTVSFIDSYCRTGVPLIQRRVTLDGPAVAENAGNYIVPIGLRIKELLKYGKAENAEKVIYGGPMMGLCVYDVNQPILKTTNAVIAVLKAEMPKTTPCVRCGMCIERCPMNLMPVSIQKAYLKRDVKTLKELKVNLCFNCGCCTYVCPGHRRLAENTQLAKQLILS
jgi:electron transport complex protein RnfC